MRERHRTCGASALAWPRRRLVELHGGTIQVRSDGIGRGAQFRVSLPLAVGV
ncbi:MAG TPA: hypothetical protein VKA59_11610 [Vicinamibacterales bacterium]|nr:hypothetical protein [Vicinamibacterales bacterium]